MCFLLKETCYYLSAGLIIHRTWCKMSSCVYSSLGGSSPGQGRPAQEVFSSVTLPWSRWLYKCVCSTSTAWKLCSFCSPGWSRCLCNMVSMESRSAVGHHAQPGSFLSDKPSRFLLRSCFTSLTCLKHDGNPRDVGKQLGVAFRSRTSVNW